MGVVIFMDFLNLFFSDLQTSKPRLQVSSQSQNHLPSSALQIPVTDDNTVLSLSNPGKYHDLERQLIQEFTAAQRRGEIGRMREVAAVLLHFKVTSYM